MPYVKRDSLGQITALFAAEQDDVKEWLDDNHPEVIAFLRERFTGYVFSKADNKR